MTDTTRANDSHTSIETSDADPFSDLITGWLDLPEIAERFGIEVTRVRQQIRERLMLAVRRGGVLYVPAKFIEDDHIIKGLPGVLTLLADAGFSDDEALIWLFTADDSLPGAPVDALVENRGTEVKRRAQALGF